MCLDHAWDMCSSSARLLPIARSVRSTALVHRVAVWMVQFSALSCHAVLCCAACAVCSNRSVCQLSLGNPQEALSDAQRACELRPNWEKGSFRKGAALEALGQLQQVRLPSQQPPSAAASITWCLQPQRPALCWRQNLSTGHTSRASETANLHWITELLSVAMPSSRGRNSTVVICGHACP
jgi:hypothetical protein